MKTYKEILGKSTWKFLHTFSRGLKDKLNNSQQIKLKLMFQYLADLYPCKECRINLKNHLNEIPIDTSSGNNFRLFLCKLHNKVNKMLNKQIYICK